jgi:hypothetical protein
MQSIAQSLDVLAGYKAFALAKGEQVFATAVELLAIEAQLGWVSLALANKEGS